MLTYLKVSKQKNKQTHHNDIGSSLVKIFANLLESSGIQISNKHNAIYGISHIATMLICMCKDGITSETTSNDLQEMPSARWLRDKLATIDQYNMENLCDAMLQRTIKKLDRTIPVKVAIDKHLIPRYDKDNMLHLVYSKIKNGTKQFECYATMQIVDSSANLVLDCACVTRASNNVDFVRKFMEKLTINRIKTSLILLDREFYFTDVIRVMCKHKRKFLMPARKNSTVKRIIEQYHRGEIGCVYKYVMNNAFGNSARFNLVLTRSNRYNDESADIYDKYLVFATNLDVKYALNQISRIPQEYKKRWGIETGYRQIKQIRPRTTSRNHLIRILLFYVSLFMHNMWTILKDKSYGTITVRILLGAAAMIAITGVPNDGGG